MSSGQDEAAGPTEVPTQSEPSPPPPPSSPGGCGGATEPRSDVDGVCIDAAPVEMPATNGGDDGDGAGAIEPAIGPEDAPKAANQSEGTTAVAANHIEDAAVSGANELDTAGAIGQSEEAAVCVNHTDEDAVVTFHREEGAIAASSPRLDYEAAANQVEDELMAAVEGAGADTSTNHNTGGDAEDRQIDELAAIAQAAANENVSEDFHGAVFNSTVDDIVGVVKSEAVSQSADPEADANDESEAARQAASWIEDASEAASAADAPDSINGSLAALSVPKLEPMALLDAKAEPMEASSDQVHLLASSSDRKPVNGNPASPASQPCSSASGQSSQIPAGVCKTLESALTRRQRHDLELTGSCPRCEKFREQIVFDENNEPQPGINILPDYLAEGLDMVVIGINPSITSAYIGHHYAGPGNHFWSCIYESGLIAEPLTCHDDHRIVQFGIGFTNVCTRPTKGAAELTRKEMKEGADILLAKLNEYKPKIAVFNGKGIYEAFVGNKNFYMGKQPEPLVGTDIVLFVMPSSSARCAQLPRAADKLPFYTALRKLRDYVVGLSSHLNDADVVFTDYTEMRVTQPDPKSVRKAERRRKRKAELAAAAERNAAAAAAADTKEAPVPVKLAAMPQPHHHQQQQQQQSAAAAATAALLRTVKMEATSTAGGSIGALAGQQPGQPQYALLTQQPGQSGHYEWQIYQPTLYYQLAAGNPGDQTGAGGAAAAAAAAYLRPQLQILPESTADGQPLGFANVLLLDPSQLAAAAAATSVASGGVALLPSTMAAASMSQDRQPQQAHHHMTYTTL